MANCFGVSYFSFNKEISPYNNSRELRLIGHRSVANVPWKYNNISSLNGKVPGLTIIDIVFIDGEIKIKTFSNRSPFQYKTDKAVFTLGIIN